MPISRNLIQRRVLMVVGQGHCIQTAQELAPGRLRNLESSGADNRQYGASSRLGVGKAAQRNTLVVRRGRETSPLRVLSLFVSFCFVLFCFVSFRFPFAHRPGGKGERVGGQARNVMDVCVLLLGARKSRSG